MNRAAATGMAVMAATVLSTAAVAQGPGGGGPGGGFQMPPEMRAKFQAWQKWRDNNKNIAAIQQTLAGFNDMDQDPKTQLTKDQARKITPVLKAWRTKPVMTDDQARKVNQQLTAPLTQAQLKKVATARSFGGRRGGGGGPGGGGGMGGGMRPGGGPPGGGQGGGMRPGGQGGPGGMRFSMPDPKPYNPLNPESSPFFKANPQMGTRMLSRFTDTVAKIEARAK